MSHCGLIALGTSTRVGEGFEWTNFAKGAAGALRDVGRAMTGTPTDDQRQAEAKRVYELERLRAAEEKAAKNKWLLGAAIAVPVAAVLGVGVALLRR